MARLGRSRSFLFEPARILNDRAVQSMIAEGADVFGAYAAIFFALWDQEEPGVVLDDDRILAGLAHVTPERWKEIRPFVVKAFAEDSREGFPVLVQRALWETWRAQVRRFEERSDAGSKASKSRWDKKKDAERIPKRDAIALQVIATATAIEKEEPENLSLSLEPDAPASGRSWSSRFDVFWQAWPKGVRGKPGKAEARALWDKLTPKTSEQFEKILAGLERAKASRQWLEQGGKFIPDPPKWIRRQRWEDELEADISPGSSLEAWASEDDQGGEHDPH